VRPLVRSQPVRVGTVEEPPRNAAKAAGLAYLVSFAVIVFVEYGIYQRLFNGEPILQPVNSPEVARNILAHQSMFRLGIALNMTYCVGVAVVGAAFYVALRPFGRTVALVAAITRILFAGLWILASADLFDTLRLIGGAGDLRVFNAVQLQALASVPLGIRWDHYYTGLLFWGVSTALFSYLWLRSRHIPRAYAVCGVVAGAWAAVCAFAFIVDPAFTDIVSLWWFDTPLAVFELTLSVVLLVRRLPGTSATP
jgi:Domain of unknown function (DUF4386)